MPVDQMLHLRIAERPNQLVITPPDETEFDLEKKDSNPPKLGSATDLSHLSRIYRLTP